MISPCQRQGIQTAISPEGCLEASPLSMRTGPQSSSPLCVGAQLLHLCLTFCDTVDCGPPGSSVHGILQARILKRAAMPSWDLPNQESNCIYLRLLHCRQILYPLSHPGSPSCPPASHKSGPSSDIHRLVHCNYYSNDPVYWVVKRAGSVTQTCRFESRLFQLKARVSWKSAFNLPVPQFLHL